MVALRGILHAEFDERADGDGEALFEKLPQGTRILFGIPRTNETYLRPYVLKVNVSTPVAVVDDNSFADLERSIVALQTIQSGTKKEGGVSPTFGTFASMSELTKNGRTPQNSIRLATSDPDLYLTIRGMTRSETPPRAIYLVHLRLPYRVGAECDECHVERVASYGYYYVQSDPEGEPVCIGSDFLDVSAADSDIASQLPEPSAVAYPFYCLFESLSRLNDGLFRNPILGFVPNSVANVGVNGFIFVKEELMQVVVAPCAFFASFLSPDDPSWERARRSGLQPLKRIVRGGIFRTQWAIACRDSWRRPFLSYAWDLCQQLPLIGPYFFDALNEPWANYAEAPPIPNFGRCPESTKWRSRLDSEARPYVFLSRGVHGDEAPNLGDDVWIEHTRLALANADVAIQPSIRDAEYAYGTVADTIFGMLNLSQGFAFEMADQIASSIENDSPGCAITPTDGATIVILAHSGGIQRASIAARLLWRRNIFTQRLYAAAGPTLGPVPTKPNAYRVILNIGEFQRSDFTSWFSNVVAEVELVLARIAEFPIVGPIWMFSAPSKSYYQPVNNEDIFRTGASEAFTHHNPGIVRDLHRDASLGFFEQELPHLVRVDQLQRLSYIRAVLTRPGEKKP